MTINNNLKQQNKAFKHQRMQTLKANEIEPKGTNFENKNINAD